MYLKLRTAVLAVALAGCIGPIAARQGAAHGMPSPGTGAIECRILEAHSSTNPPVLLVIFHQRDKADQPRLEAELKQMSGGTVEVQVGDSPWAQMTVFRLKSSFGRGLLVVPAGALEMKEGGTFRIRFSSAIRKD